MQVVTTVASDHTPSEPQVRSKEGACPPSGKVTTVPAEAGAAMGRYRLAGGGALTWYRHLKLMAHLQGRLELSLCQACTRPTDSCWSPHLGTLSGRNQLG